VGGIPPRPSVLPERSGGGQFRSKNVRAELYNSTTLEKGKPEEAASLRSAAKLSFVRLPDTIRLWRSYGTGRRISDFLRVAFIAPPWRGENGSLQRRADALSQEYWI